MDAQAPCCIMRRVSGPEYTRLPNGRRTSSGACSPTSVHEPRAPPDAAPTIPPAARMPKPRSMAYSIAAASLSIAVPSFVRCVVRDFTSLSWYAIAFLYTASDVVLSAADVLCD